MKQNKFSKYFKFLLVIALIILLFWFLYSLYVNTQAKSYGEDVYKIGEALTEADLIDNEYKVDVIKDENPKFDVYIEIEGDYKGIVDYRAIFSKIETIYNTLNLQNNKGIDEIRIRYKNKLVSKQNDIIRVNKD